MNPAVAMLMSGSFPTHFYSKYKDSINADINPWQTEMAKLDPGQLFSKKKNAYRRDNSASGILMNAQIKNMLKGFGIGGLAGAAAGGLANFMGGNSGGNLARDLGYGALAGGTVGGIGGNIYGSYTGANQYNELLKKKMLENQAGV
jgi:hypothetical protein